MSTFMLKNTSLNFTPVSDVFIEKYMVNARGEFVKVYLLLLKYNTSNEPGVNGAILASSLNLLESDVMNALNYWNDQGVIKLVRLDKMNNFNIEFLPLDDVTKETPREVNLLEALNNTDTTDMLRDIERIVGRPLSSKEMEIYLGWQRDFSFSAELILILVEYCASKGKSDYRYIEKVALAWHDMGINSIPMAQTYIKQTEDKWIKFRKILAYLGIKNAEIMKPQEQLLEKWLFTYKFDLPLIQKASDICFERLNRADFKYIDGILSKWVKENIKTMEEVAAKDKQHKSTYNKPAYSTNGKNNNSNTGFNNFEPRSYDYDSLEKKLLGWDNDD
ncbi:DnaD domain protein [Clostridium vincentii]|uniref:Replication initiation and membrane attachment n=1 Tax=Clostridium vincentii TaxID=52704 RepID=A0A2T0BE63_9CLOT|nr:DnaD domain protein [Clostridium vincentii]PRR82191.1 Replication initiation and membrane attachment [Clostridium vincentii]